MRRGARQHSQVPRDRRYTVIPNTGASPEALGNGIPPQLEGPYIAKHEDFRTASRGTVPTAFESVSLLQ